MHTSKIVDHYGLFWYNTSIMSNPEIARALNLQVGERVPGDLLRRLPSVDEVVHQIRTEIPTVPDIDFFMHFAPAKRIMPINKPGIIHHQREHGANVNTLLITKLLLEQSRGRSVPSYFIEAAGWFGSYHDARRSNDEMDLQHGELIAQEIEHDNTGITRVPKYIRKLVCRMIREHVPEDTHKIHSLTRDAKAIDGVLWWRTNDFKPEYFRDMTTVELLPLVPALLRQTSLELRTEKDGYVAGLRAAATIGIINW